MRFFVDGFTWEASQAKPARPLAKREEAIAALERLSPTAQSTSYGRQARAAFSVSDFTRVIDCCHAAEEAGSAERWR